MAMPLRVLLVEDQPADADLMLHELRRAGFELTWCRVETSDSYCASLDPSLDIILADYRLPQFDALRALRLLQENQLDIPLLIVTGSQSEEAAVECMKEGASDYLLKDRLTRLGPAVSRALERKRLRAEKRQADQRICASLKEKEVLLREIHHRVKNNLQVICSLLKLQSAYLKDKQILDVLRESQNRIRSIALVHEKLYRTEDLSRINMADYVPSLAAHLLRACGVTTEAITVDTDVQPVRLNVETAIPCGLILNELVTNALLHAFPDGRGRLTIRFCCLFANCFQLCVRDNGVGLPVDADPRKGGSLGWQLIGALADQLKAEVEVASAGGTAVTLTFDELRYKERGLDQ
jgi:two-component sensor histidine kinase/CheY-like chemotaxis protein